MSTCFPLCPELGHCSMQLAFRIRARSGPGAVPMQVPRDKCDLSGSSSDERCEIRLGRVEIAYGCCYADPGNVDWSRWMPSHPLLLTASPLRKTPTQGDVPNPDSETGHGETVSIKDPHRQPHAASRNADAELRLRSATVGRSRQTAGLPDLDLRLQDRRRWTGLLRFRLGSPRAARWDG